MNAYSTLNITKGDKAKVFAAVGRAADPQFPSFVNGFGANRTISVEPGRKGLFCFTVTYRCYAGVLEDCLAEVGVPNGTEVEACLAEVGVPYRTEAEACWPASLDGETSQGVPILDGSGNCVDTDQETIANMTTSPAAETPQNVPSEVKFGTGNGLLMAISMVIMGLGGWLLL